MNFSPGWYTQPPLLARSEASAATNPRVPTLAQLQRQVGEALCSPTRRPAQYQGACSGRPPRPLCGSGRARRHRLGCPPYLRMLSEVPRFHRRARALLAGEGDDRTLRDFLEAAGSRRTSRGTSWSRWSRPCGPATPRSALEYPARYLFAFLSHHGMLSVTGSPQWRTVTGGSHEYVRRRRGRGRRGPHGHQGHLGGRDPGRRRGDRRQRRGDDVRRRRHRHPPRPRVAMLADPTPAHREVLGAITYSPNVALLHTDTSLLPRPRRRGRRGTSAAPSGSAATSPSPTTSPAAALPTQTHYLVTLAARTSSTRRR